MADSTNVGAIDLELILNSKKFQTQLNNTVNSSLKDMNSKTSKSNGFLAGSFKKLGLAAAAAFSVKEIVNFSKQCLDLGSDLSEVQNVVDTAFPAMSKQVDAFASTAITNFGLSETVAKRYSGTFGAMSKAFGFTEAEAVNMSTTLTGLAGDVASFYNISGDEAYTKLKSVFTGETESLKDLGVVMTQTALDQFALSKGLGKTTSQMSEQEKTALRYQFVLDKLSIANGDFAKTSDSWANQTRVMKLQFDSIKASLGQGLINALTPAIKMLNEMLAKLKVIADQFSVFTAKVFGKQQNALGITDDIKNAVTGTKDLTQGIENTGKAFKKLKRGLAGFDELNTIGELNTNNTSTVETTPVDTTLLDKKGEESANGFSEKFKKALDKVANYFKDLYDNHIKPYVDEVIDLGKEIWELFKVIGDWFENFGGGIFSRWLGMCIDVSKGIIRAIKGIIEFLTGVFTCDWEKAWQGIKDFFGGIWDSITSIVSYFSDIIYRVEQWLIEKIKEIWEPVGEWFSTYIIEPLEKVFSEAWNKIKTWAEEAWNKIKEIWEPVANWFDITVAQPVKNFFSGVCQSMRDDAVTAWNWIKSTWGVISDWFKTVIINPMINFFESFINTIIGGLNYLVRMINKIKFDVPDWVPGIGGKEFGFKLSEISKVSIPRLAQGGYVRANTPQLAMIGDNKHEGEIVAPESKIQEAVTAGLLPVMNMLLSAIQGNTSNGANGKTSINLTQYLDSEIIAKKVFEYNNKLMENGKPSPLRGY